MLNKSKLTQSVLDEVQSLKNKSVFDTYKGIYIIYGCSCFDCKVIDLLFVTITQLNTVTCTSREQINNITSLLSRRVSKNHIYVHRNSLGICIYSKSKTLSSNWIDNILNSTRLPT